MPSLLPSPSFSIQRVSIDEVIENCGRAAVPQIFQQDELPEPELTDAEIDAMFAAAPANLRLGRECAMTLSADIRVKFLLFADPVEVELFAVYIGDDWTVDRLKDCDEDLVASLTESVLGRVKAGAL